MYLFYILGVYKKLEKIGKRKRKGFTIVGRWARSISNQHMMLEIQVLAWDRHKHVAGLNQLMGSQIFPFDNWVSMLTILFNF
jgi:hypothetical protein